MTSSPPVRYVRRDAAVLQLRPGQSTSPVARLRSEAFPLRPEVVTAASPGDLVLGRYVRPGGAAPFLRYVRFREVLGYFCFRLCGFFRECWTAGTGVPL